METLTIRNLPTKEARAKIGKAARAIYESLMHGAIENGLHPRLRITLASPTGPIEFKALFDSGFGGQVALPYFAADRLRLREKALYCTIIPKSPENTPPMR